MKKRFIAFLLSLIVLVSAPAAELSATSVSDILSGNETEEIPDITEEDGKDAGYTLDGMTITQSNSINMLNYMTVLTQEINDSKGNRLFLETAYSSLINNIYPNAVDTRTQAQLTSTLDTLESYRMISQKRERLEYMYDQNQAQALRSAIPSPVAMLNVVQAGKPLKIAASVLYLAVNAASSYASAKDAADFQFLQDGWELDDQEAAELHNSRKAAFSYMLSMVRDNDLPGDYALNENAVSSFVEWKNNTNLERRKSWLEKNEETYKVFGPYWLEMAKIHYEAEEFEKCLEDIKQYQSVSTRIFRKDHDYAETLPIAIISAKETKDSKDYIALADEYAASILKNTDDTDWSLRYFVAQIYMDLYASTKNATYLDNAYQIAFNNVNVLVDQQKELNAAYISDLEEVEADKDATKREKSEVKQYNKMLKEERKIELPPVSEALYLNCDLLFALADELNLPAKEQTRIDNILHEKGEPIFLTKALDERFWFNQTVSDSSADEISVEFDGKEFEVPVTCMTDRSKVEVRINGTSGNTILDDWNIKEVKRPKKSSYDQFTAVYTSKKGKDYKYTPGDKVTVVITPVVESPEKTVEFTYKAIETKTLFIKGIKFEREAK